MNVLQSAAIFLISFTLDLFIMLVLLRVLLQWFKVKPSNSFFQLLLKITNPVIQPIRSIFPAKSKLDIAAISVAITLIIIKLMLIFLIKEGSFVITGLPFLILAEFFKQILNIFFFAILLVVLLSWINPHTHNPIIEVLYVIVEPILRYIRRRISPVGGWDLSPLIALVGIKLIDILLVGSLYSLAH